MSPPVDASAVVWEGRSYVVYADADGTISFLMSPIGKEEDLETPYEAREIRVNDVTIKARSTEPKVTAVAYVYNDVHEFRIYYVDPNGKLAELQRNSNEGWKSGALNRAKISAISKSSLSSLVDDDGVKLYFQKEEGAMHVTWCAKSKTQWTLGRDIGSF